MTSGAQKSISQALAEIRRSTHAQSMHTPGIRSENREVIGRQLSRLVFVGGCPRSGTTLVQRVLDCHPDIYGGPEFDFVPPLSDLFRTMQEAVSSGRIDNILSERDLVDAFRLLLIGLLLPKLENEGLNFLSEKTPSNVLAFDWLDKCAPESKKILVLRDPRDVVSSMLAVGQRQRARQGRAFDFVRDTVTAVDYMNRCLEAGTGFAETASNCLAVYYEDLVANPLAVANQMFRFIGAHELNHLDLENERFHSARNQDSWVDWATPGTISRGVRKDRIGVGAHLRRSDLDYICAKSLNHPLLTQRYPMDSRDWTFAAHWCRTRCWLSRIREGTPGLLSFLRQRLTG